MLKAQGALSRHPVSLQTEHAHSPFSFIPGQLHSQLLVPQHFFFPHFQSLSVVVTAFQFGVHFVLPVVFTAYSWLHILLLDMLSPSPRPTLCLCVSDFRAVWLRAVPFAPVDLPICSLRSLSPQCAIVSTSSGFKATLITNNIYTSGENNAPCKQL